MEKITKVYDASLDIAEGKREVLAIISTNAVDRDNEVVQPTGMKKKNYAGNPVVMVNHDYRSLPVGRSLWVKADGDKVLAKSYISDKTQLSRDVFGLMQDGVLSAFSIGFASLRASEPSTKEINARPELKSAKLIHREWELLEYSVVGIPANPEALTLAVSKGYSQETLDVLSGKNIKTAEAAIEVVKEVVEEIAEKGISKKELIKALENRIKAMDLSAVNVDRAIAKAFDLLKNRTR